MFEVTQCQSFDKRYNKILKFVPSLRQKFSKKFSSFQGLEEVKKFKFSVSDFDVREICFVNQTNPPNNCPFAPVWLTVKGKQSINNNKNSNKHKIKNDWM